MIIISYDWHIVWDCHNGLIAFMDKSGVAISHVFGTDIAAKFDLIGILRSAKFEWIAIL